MGKMKLTRKPGGLRGPLPTEPRIWCELVLEKRPNDQWMADNQTLINEDRAPEPSDDDMLVGINIYGYMAFPSNKLPPKLWKQGRKLIGTLHEIDYAEFRADCEKDIAMQQQDAPGNHKMDLAEVAEMARAAAKGKPKEEPS